MKVGYLIAIGIFLVGIVGFLSFDVLSSYTSTISLDSVNLKSSDSLLNGKALLLTFTQGQGISQKYVGTITASDINNQLDGEKVKNGFSIEVNYDDQQCIYDIINSNSDYPIYKNIDFKSWLCTGSPSEERAKEKTGYSKIISRGFFFLGVAPTCYAIGTNEWSPVGILSPPTTSLEYDITVSTPDGTETKTLSSTKSGTARFGNFAYAQHQGSLVSSTDCTREAVNQDNYIPVYDNGRWKISDKSRYNSYKIKYLDFPSPNKNDIENYVEQLNTLSKYALSSVSLGSLKNRYSYSEAELIATLDTPVQFPVTSLYIKAETLGIVTLVPEFKILSASAYDFQSGDEGYIGVEVQNTGDESGNAIIYANCNGVISCNDRESINLNKGEVGKVNLRVTGSSSSDKCETCRVYVEWLGRQSYKDTRVCVTPLLTCTPNDVFCSVNNGVDVVKKCNSQGTLASIIDTCSGTETCEYGECVKIGTITPSKNIFQIIADAIKGIFQGVIDLFMLLKYIIVAVGGFFGFDISKNLFKKVEKISSNNYLLNGLSLLVGGLVALFLYNFIYAPIFWISAIGLGVYFVIRRFFL